MEGLEELSVPFIQKCKQVGLECNVEKTKVMLLSRRERIDGTVNIGDMEIRCVENFKYLGSTITAENLMDKEISERIGCGNRCAFALDKVLKSRNISRKTKFRIYNVIILPTVLYSCETWTLTKERMRKLEVFENSILHRILGPIFDATINHWRRRHNVEIRNLSSQPFIHD